VETNVADARAADVPARCRLAQPPEQVELTAELPVHPPGDDRPEERGDAPCRVDRDVGGDDRPGRRRGDGVPRVDAHGRSVEVELDELVGSVGDDAAANLGRPTAAAERLDELGADHALGAAGDLVGGHVGLPARGQIRVGDPAEHLGRRPGDLHRTAGNQGGDHLRHGFMV
jgi:hypothetical protein